MNLTLKMLHEIQKNFVNADLDNGIIASHQRVESIEASCSKSAGDVISGLDTFMGLKVFPCVHLKSDEIYVTSGDVKPYDFLGFINFCEATGLNWRILLKAVQPNGVKNG